MIELFKEPWIWIVVYLVIVYTILRRDDSAQ
jgi:hypothetical protein